MFFGWLPGDLIDMDSRWVGGRSGNSRPGRSDALPRSRVTANLLGKDKESEPRAAAECRNNPAYGAGQDMHTASAYSSCEENEDLLMSSSFQRPFVVVFPISPGLVKEQVLLACIIHPTN